MQSLAGHSMGQVPWGRDKVGSSMQDGLVKSVVPWWLGSSPMVGAWLGREGS